jgi:hypothetical protein
MDPDAVHRHLDEIVRERSLLRPESIDQRQHLATPATICSGRHAHSQV